jgi:hypothetical protein
MSELVSPDGSIQQSVLKQVECPTTAQPGPYGAFKGLGFMLGDAFPEMIGYMFAYNFSGLGSNDSGFFGKMGFLGIEDSKRILGYNYFLPVNASNAQPKDRTKCNSRSGACAGKEPHMYIRGYPLSNSGNLSFGIFEDLLDLNPVSVVEAMFASLVPGGPTCVQTTLPVGSNFNFCGKQPGAAGVPLGYQKVGGSAVNAFVAACKTNCTTVFKDEETDYKQDNCQKDCARIWWEETKCILKPDATHSPAITYPLCNGKRSREYKIPIGKGNESGKAKDSATQPVIKSSVKDPNAGASGANANANAKAEPFLDAAGDGGGGSRQRASDRYRHRCIGRFIVSFCLCLVLILLLGVRHLLVS